MWRINEHRSIEKICSKLPVSVVKKYELWKNIVFLYGPEKLREFPGFHNEKMKGKYQDKRSSRLSLLYRVIYSVERDIFTIYVLNITPHNY